MKFKIERCIFKPGLISFLFYSLFSTITVLLHGQTKKIIAPEAEDADFLFKYQNYRDAIPIYLQLLEKNPKNYIFNYRLGFCYLNTNINKPHALPYLRNCVKSVKLFPDIWQLLGRAYHLNNQFDSAIYCYKKHIDLNIKASNEKDRLKVDVAIRQAENAKSIYANPVKVHFYNMGTNINTEFPDYIPWVTSDEKRLYFTSRRKSLLSREIETDGYFSSDIYVSEDINGKWEKSKLLIGPGINSALDEELVGMRPDGEELIIYKDHIKDYGDLYFSLKNNNNFRLPEKYGNQINGEIEYSGSISEDDELFFFVRKTKSKNSNQDIYFCKKLPNGSWGLPISAGPEINTELNEDYPFLSMDGKTFYFSSEGHNSMGGYDLFKCQWNPDSNRFSNVVNLGYPLNTADDEKNISILPDNRAGYISAWRKDGMGDLDVYRVKFDESEMPYVFINAKVIYDDSTQCVKSNAKIYVTTKPEKKVLGVYKPHSIHGNFILALVPGSYEIHIENEGYENYTELLQISDIGATQHEESKTFKLQKITE
ncbi:MAG: hypothetical protein ACK5AY_13525 [Bacteroidota bacterium]